MIIKSKENTEVEIFKFIPENKKETKELQALIDTIDSDNFEQEIKSIVEKYQKES